MDKVNYVLCGMAFGDEGKGSFVDYLVHNENIKHTIRYNGGSHAGHSVLLPSGAYHQFSQLGSGMFFNGSSTYLTENMVINIENLIEEAKQFGEKTDMSVQEVLNKILIHKNCYLVTPYHKLLNRLKELSRGKNRFGSVGSGVSETMTVVRTKGLGITAVELKTPAIFKNKLKDIYEYMMFFLKDNEKLIKENTTHEIFKASLQGLWFLTTDESLNYIYQLYMDILSKYKINICESLDKYLKDADSVVCEGSQGLLLDYVYGFRPNTTALDTTNQFAVKLLTDLGKKNMIKVGIFKAVSSRHGMGVFPTEDVILNSQIKDENQMIGFWNGSIRFGWFDSVLARYAQMINNVDEVFLSSLDKLDSFKEIKACNAYTYSGEINDEFESLFEYERINGQTVIRNIKRNSDNITQYIKKCSPIYTTFNGWCEDTSIKNSESELPSNCINYIKELERMIRIKISLVSVGPTRNHKIRIGKQNES